MRLETERAEQINQQPKMSSWQEQEEFVRARLQKMYSCPPNDEDADIHKAASTFGYNPPFQKKDKITVCPCCLLPFNTIKLPITVSTTPMVLPDGKIQFFVLDSGASMFFTFIKATIIFLAILFALSGLYPIHASFFSRDYCKMNEEMCGDSWFINFSPVKFSGTNYRYNYDIMNVLNTVMIGASIIFFIAFRRYQYDIYGMLDLNNETQDDFTVLVKNIPIQLDLNETQLDNRYEKVLKKLFVDKIDHFINQTKQYNGSSSEHKAFCKLIKETRINPEQMDKVRAISLSFDLHEINKLLEQRQQLMNEHLQKSKQLNGSQKIEQLSIADKIQQLNKSYIQLCKNYLHNKVAQGDKSHFIGKAFVSFEFQHYRNYIMHLYSSHPQEFLINGKQIKISRASFPSDYNWSNLKIKSRVGRIILSYLLLLVVLVIVFLIITGIQVSQQAITEVQSSQQDTLINRGIGYGITVLVALIVYLVNYLLGITMKYMTDKQRHQTKTKHLISLIIKMFVAQFLNSAIMYFLLSFREGSKYLQNGGLVPQISNLMIISGFISVPMNFFQMTTKLQHYWRKFKYGFWYYDRLFQVQYNQINQPPEFDFADRYSYYLVQMFTLVFYSYINPICVPAMIIIIILHYWIDKYNLFNNSSNTFPMNFVISRAVLKIFELSIVVFAWGNYYFSNKLRDEFSMINFIGLLVAAAYAVLAVFSPAYIEEKIFGSEHQIEWRSYSECLSDGSFRQTYWDTNPATMFNPQPQINVKSRKIDRKMTHQIANISDLHAFTSKGNSIVFE